MDPNYRKLFYRGRIVDNPFFFFYRPDVPESFDVDVEALKTSVPGNEGVIEAITVGSEALYREAFTGPELLEKIQQVQKLFPKVTVGTADSWNKFADGTADALITGGVKYLYAHTRNDNHSTRES